MEHSQRPSGGGTTPDNVGAVRSRRPRSGPLGAPSVVVTSDLVLVAEAIAAALAHHGFRASFVPWPSVVASSHGPTAAPDDPAGLGEADVVLVVRDLGPAAALQALRDWAPGRRGPWVVMSDARRGPAWGGALEVGARAVVAGSSSLGEVVAALGVVARGGSPMSAAERLDLVRAWRLHEERRAFLRERVGSLSQRERQVLGMLHEGRTVREIALRLAVSEATVRSQVRAVLRKLGVDSQLSAVAILSELAQEARDWY